MEQRAGFMGILADRGFVIRCYRDILDTAVVIKDGKVVGKDEDYMGHMLHCFETLRYKFIQFYPQIKDTTQWEEKAASKIAAFFGWYSSRKVQLKKVGKGYTWTFEWERGGRFSVWREDCVEGFERGMEILQKMGLLTNK